MIQNNTTKTLPVITVGRQFGSGGRELGRRLAEAFGMAYYDKELLREAAQRAGVSTEFFERNDERKPSFFNSLFAFAPGMSPMGMLGGSSNISDDSLYQSQSDFISNLASEQPCVIVGRTADYVLRDNPNVLRLFVHAPLDECARRIMQRDPGLTFDKAKTKAMRINKLRAGYYNFYTDRTWGAADSYDLSIDTSVLPMDAIVEVVAEYIRQRFGVDPRQGLQPRIQR